MGIHDNHMVGHHFFDRVGIGEVVDVFATEQPLRKRRKQNNRAPLHRCRSIGGREETKESPFPLESAWYCLPSSTNGIFVIRHPEMTRHSEYREPRISGAFSSQGKSGSMFVCGPYRPVTGPI
jgi:hypothetical protein